MYKHKPGAVSQALLLPTAILAASAAVSADILLEEIVVTAQKREQNLQDVPLSITALSGAALQRAGVTDIASIETLTPGLQFGQSGNDARPSIRGARTENVSVQQDPVIGFFVDGIYRSRTSQALAAFVDVDRVEVLRGPQGTLFGRNTFGGAINVISNQPIDEQAYGFDVTLGDYDRRRVEGFFNAVLADGLYARISTSVDEHEPYVENSLDSDNGFRDKDENYLRVQLLWEPRDDFDATLRASRWTQGGNGASEFGYFLAGTPVDTGSAAAVINSTLSPVNPRTGGGNGPAGSDPFRVNYDADASLDTEQETLDLELNWDLQAFSTKLLLGYADFETERFTDSDLSPNPSAVAGQIDSARTLTAELQLTSGEDGPLQWTTGLYYLDDDTRGIFIFDRLFDTDPATNLPILTQPAPDSDFISDASVETTSVAVYGQATYAFTEALSVTAGVRWSEDEKDFSRRTGFSFSEPLDFSGRPVFEDEDSFDEVTWRLGLEYALSDASLVYASAATGFQSGGFNNSADAVTGGASFEEQTVTAFEVGSKNRLLDGRLTVNVAAFLNEFDDLLAQEFIDTGTTVLAIATNAGEATVMGLEAEVDWIPTDNLLLNIRATFNDSEFGEFVLNEPVSGEAIDLDGERVPLTPDFTLGLNGQYDFELTQGVLTPAISVYYSSDYSTNDIDYRFAEQDSYSKVDLRLTYTSANRGWYVELFGRNVGDEEILNRTVRFGQNAIAQNYNDPATYGIRFGFRQL